MIHEFYLALTFLTRLPIGKGRDFTDLRLGQCVWAFPLIGAIIGALAAIVYGLALALGISQALCGWMTLAFLVFITGGLHEDGLADMADGLAHGRALEEKLAIMRDSRIGAYGVLALVLTLAIRATAIAEFSNFWHALWGFVAACACSRAMMALLMLMLPPARTDGLAEHAGKPTPRQVISALALGVFMLAPLQDVLLLGCALTLMVIFLIMQRLALKHFGGITGDVLGALQQVSEVALLVCVTLK